jgi:hypothetical protein
MKDLPNIEHYMPLDRDRLDEGRKNITRNYRTTNNNESERSVENESVNTVTTQVDNNNRNLDSDDDDDVIFIDVIRAELL